MDITELPKKIFDEIINGDVSKLDYNENEINDIITKLDSGDFSFPKKHDYKFNSKNKELDDLWKKEENSGIDLPVLCKSKKKITLGTIILLGSDPKRSKRYWDKSEFKGEGKSKERQGRVIIGTPFALHLLNDKNYRIPKNLYGYLLLINKLTNLGYNVYCTDISKIYFTKGINELYKNKTGKIIYKKLSPNDFKTDFNSTILEKEIQSINPCLVILMGGIAQDVFKVWYPQPKFATLPIIHLSELATIHWKRLFDKENIKYGKTPKDIINDKTNYIIEKVKKMAKI